MKKAAMIVVLALSLAVMGGLVADQASAQFGRGAVVVSPWGGGGWGWGGCAPAWGWGGWGCWPGYCAPAYCGPSRAKAKSPAKAKDKK